MLAGSCGAVMQQLKCGCAPSCPHVWMTVGPMASASCCAPTTTCTQPASARLVSGLGCGAGHTGGFLGIRVASKGALGNWVWGQGEHNCLLNPRCLLSSSTLVGWRGWGCTDSADALTYGFQLLSTLLLCLSNLMFLPPVVLAVRSRYVLEAAVYTFTMFFSTVCRGAFASLCVFITGWGEGLHFCHTPWPLQFEDVF